MNEPDSGDETQLLMKDRNFSANPVHMNKSYPKLEKQTVSFGGNKDLSQYQSSIICSNREAIQMISAKGGDQQSTRAGGILSTPINPNRHNIQAD